MSVEDRLQRLEEGHRTIQSTLTEQDQVIKAIKQDTSGLVDLFRSAKMGAGIITWCIQTAKLFGTMALLAWGAWYAYTNKSPPPNP